MAQEDKNTGQEKTEQPTEKRLQESREKGEVARSKELNTVLSVLIFGVAMAIFGGSFFQSIIAMMATGLTVDTSLLLSENGLSEGFGAAALSGFYLLLPLLGVMFAAAFVGPSLMGGFVFSAQALQPKASKIDPIAGLKRVFSSQGLMELLKALSKFLLIATVAGFFLYFTLPQVMALGRANIEPGVQHAAWMLLSCLVLTGAVLVLIAALDVPFQLWQHNKKLMMTRQEVKDELKETDGRPEVRGRIRALRQEIAQRRMMQDVPTADVVIRKPTHFAVALKYDRDGTGAPRVVASGQDHVALEIIAVAEEAGVTVVSAPPLARALFAHADIGQEIPVSLYVAVAQVLAYVYQLEKSMRERTPVPDAPRDLPIPDDLQVSERT